MSIIRGRAHRWNATEPILRAQLPADLAPSGQAPHLPVLLTLLAEHRRSAGLRELEGCQVNMRGREAGGGRALCTPGPEGRPERCEATKEQERGLGLREGWRTPTCVPEARSCAVGLSWGALGRAWGPGITDGPGGASPAASAPPASLLGRKRGRDAWWLIPSCAPSMS